MQLADRAGKVARRVLRNSQWDRIKDLLPGKAGDPGVTTQDNRRFVEAVLWILRTGAPWRDLPAELGNWHTTSTRFVRWKRGGVWERVLAAVSQDADLEDVCLDSTAIRAHRHAAGAQKNMALRHWADLVAAGVRQSIWQGNPLAFTLTGAREAGTTQAQSMFEAPGRPTTVIADTGHDAAAFVEVIGSL